jgi:glutamyl/glutaminyl-tRNA synthetase
MFFTSIREIIAWLSFEPYKITYSSDHFDRLYELAEELIKFDKAYVCHCLRESCQNFHILDRLLTNLQEKKLTSNVAALTTKALGTLAHIENDLSKNP